MSIIYPGNYVAQLNAYRDQGVVALPGVEFYRQIGAVVINPDNDNVTTIDGVLAAGEYSCQVLSPDLRQDDKPRKDKPLVIPAGAVVYRTSISAPNVKAAAAGDTIEISDLGSNVGSSGTLTAESDQFFPAEGAGSTLVSIVDGSAADAASDLEVKVTTSADFTAEQDPSAGAGRKGPSAILVEVCWYVPAPAPTLDDAHVPYAIEAGQGY